MALLVSQLWVLGAPRKAELQRRRWKEPRKAAMATAACLTPESLTTSPRGGGGFGSAVLRAAAPGGFCVRGMACQLRNAAFVRIAPKSTSGEQHGAKAPDQQVSDIFLQRCLFIQSRCHGDLSSRDFFHPWRLLARVQTLNLENFLCTGGVLASLSGRVSVGPGLGFLPTLLGAGGAWCPAALCGFNKALGTLFYYKMPNLSRLSSR